MCNTLAGYMLGQFSLLQYLEFFLRIFTSCICGACIGIERTKRLKEAGVRTHVIVCCAAALTMIVSKYAFADMTLPGGASFNGTHGTDPARIAAQIISGVSFLGAGMIFRTGNSVRGLTTAAGIWATAGIGLAIGSGMYVIGIFATVLVSVIQILMHRFTVGADSMCIGQIRCTVADADTFNEALDTFSEKHHVQVLSSKITFADDGTVIYEMQLRMKAETTVSDMVRFLSAIDGVKALSCEIGR